MNESKPFFWTKTILVSVVGLGLCVYVITMVAVTAISPNQKVATVSYTVTKPVFEQRVKTIAFQVNKMLLEGDSVTIVPEHRLKELSYTVSKRVAEIRVKPVEVPRQRTETIKLYIVGFFAVFVAVYFAVLLCALIVSLRAGKTSAQWVCNRLDKTTILMLGLVGGYVSAQELPRNIPDTHIPRLYEETKFSNIDEHSRPSREELIADFQRRLNQQQESFIEILNKLNIKVSERSTSTKLQGEALPREAVGAKKGVGTIFLNASTVGESFACRK